MKLIDKDAVLAEIDKKMAKCFGNATDFATGKKMALSELKASINSLEVKEVDFDSEVNKYFKGWGNNDCHCYAMMQDGASVGVDDCIDIAKHFFELGIRASNPLTWEDIAQINSITNTLLNECKDEFLYDTEEEFSKEVLKRFKA